MVAVTESGMSNEFDAEFDIYHICDFQEYWKT